MAEEIVETAVVKVEADMKAFTKDLSAATKQAEKLGDKVVDAFEDAVLGGKNLETVFSKLALDLSKSALASGVEPLKQMLSWFCFKPRIKPSFIFNHGKHLRAHIFVKRGVSFLPRAALFHPRRCFQPVAERA